MAWRLAKSLIKLREQINAASPGRNKKSDGSVGDPRHQKAGDASDHNPHVKDPHGVGGVVTAIDVTHDPDSGVDGHLLSAKLITDTRTKYVIFSGRIWKARTQKWEKYTGKNPHDHHVHVSVRPEVMDAVVPWPWEPTHPVMDAARPVLRLTVPPMLGPDVRLLKEKLKAKGYLVVVEGVFDGVTDSAVRKFQADKELKVDGICGAGTWKALG